MDLPSVLGGAVQGFKDFGTGLVDFFGTGGANILDIIDSIQNGRLTSQRQDDFRKWLYNTDDIKDASAKGLGTILNGVQTISDYIPGIGEVTRNPLFNAGQGAMGGIADEFKMYGKDYDLGRAGQRALVSGGAALASGELANAMGASASPYMNSNTLKGAARGALGGAINQGGYTAIEGGNLSDILKSAGQGATMGGVIGGATGMIQDFKPAKTYAAGLTDDERQARLTNVQKQLDEIGPISLLDNSQEAIAKRARRSELRDLEKAYQQGFDNLAQYKQAMDEMKAAKAKRPQLSRAEYEAKIKQQAIDNGGNYEITPEKQRQFDRLQQVNPMTDDYHTGIRAPQNIGTLQEVLGSATDIDDAYRNLLQKAINDDSVTVYSSYPIKEGVFTSPMREMAQDYAGPNGQVYSKQVSPSDIAWIDAEQGNYIPRASNDPQVMEAIDAIVDSTGAKVPKDISKRLNDVSPLVRDENGNLMRFYHGTPDGSFDRFNDGSYFTPNKNYADVYQTPTASSISYGKQATNPTTFETYLDIKKPFELSDPQARKVYIDDYIKGGNALGINPYQSQSEYDAIKDIDWTEAEYLRDFLKENGYDYDAIIANEGGTFDDNGNVVSRGKSYMPFSGDQVVILNKNTPQNDPQTMEVIDALISDITPQPRVNTGKTPSLEAQDWATDMMQIADKNTMLPNELRDIIDPSTLPQDDIKLREIISSNDSPKVKQQKILDLEFGGDIKNATTRDLIDYFYGNDIKSKQKYERKMASRGLTYDSPEVRKGAEKSTMDKIKAMSNDSVDSGFTATADTLLSERLGIGPSTTYKYNHPNEKSFDVKGNAHGRYLPNRKDISVREYLPRSNTKLDAESALSATGHERLHSFQRESDWGRYDKEVSEAYKQLHEDLKPYIKDMKQTKQLHPKKTKYYQKPIEQEARMFQQYLSDNGYTGNTKYQARKNGVPTKEFSDKINPAFDKFINKLQKLSKKGVALPAITALLGGGAYLTTTADEKDKEIR